MSGPAILVADDEPEIRRALHIALTELGYAVQTVPSGEEAVASVERSRPDVILMDLFMPGMGGLEACKRIRERWAVPIIVLSVMGEEKDKVAALDAGADDYLTKPFGMEELLARIRVALRHAAAIKSGTEPVYRSADLVVDMGQRRVVLGDEEIHLTPTEYNVLTYLAANAGRVVTRGMVLRAVWGPEYSDESQLLRYTIMQLRKKLRDDPVHPHFLLTEPGIGYRFRTDS
jgi:two-component system, OmpR family, KDP operon response regulator KdpE